MLAVLLLISIAAPVTADSLTTAPVVTADLEGQPIAVAEVPLHHCHDRDFPQIHCFDTRGDLQLAVSVDRKVAGVQVTAASDYVVVFAGTSYTGASMTLAQDYATLAVVNWNDRIRSYRGLNGATGAFYKDWFGGGTGLQFCCNVQDPSLPSGLDQAITSAYRH
jgi:hypothetical protein